MLLIDSIRKKPETILQKHPNAILADVTSKAKDGLVKLSPFYPHGGIPVPFSEGYTATCVEAVWQGLKVFENCGIDTELLGYIEARKLIYVPTYLWVLEHKVQDIIHRMAEASKKQTIILLDYDTNADIENPKKPLSHASLIKRYVDSLTEPNQPTLF